MNALSKALEKISVLLIKFCRLICIITTSILVVLVIAQVFMRFVLNMGYPWIEEICMLCMMWIAFFGGSLIFQDQSGISVTFLVDRLQPRAYKIAKLSFHILTIVFLVFLVIYGFQFAKVGLRMKFAATGLPKFWSYLSIPVGGIVSILFELIHLLACIGSSPEEYKARCTEGGDTV